MYIGAVEERCKPEWLGITLLIDNDVDQFINEQYKLLFGL